MPSVEEVAAIELGRLARAVDGVAGREPVEALDVDADALGGEVEDVAVFDDQARRQEPECILQLVDEAADAGAVFAAEQERGRFAGGRFLTAQRHVYDERLRFPIADRQRVAAVIGRRELAEQTNCEERHRVDPGKSNRHGFSVKPDFLPK
jgi:hypothetical protein